MKNLSSMQQLINFSYFEHFRRKLCIPTDTSIVHLHNIGNLSSSHKYSISMTILENFHTMYVERGYNFRALIYLASLHFIVVYRKVASSRPVYYSILDSLGQRSQYTSMKFPLHKQSGNPKMCY